MDEERTLEGMTFEEPIEPTEEPVEPVEQTEAPAEPVEQPVELPAQPEVQPVEQYGNTMDFAGMNQQIASLQNQNQQLMAELESMRREQVANAERINQNVAEAMTEPPAWDDDAYAYASDSERASIRSEYDRKMLEYATAQAEQRVMDRMKPLLQQYEANNANMEFDNSLRQLSAMDGWSDIGNRSNDIRRLADRPEFQHLPMNQRVVQAALIDRGIRAGGNAPVKDDATLAEEIYNNPNVMRLIAEKQARAVQENNNVPVFSTSNGLSSAAYPSGKRPERLEDLY